MPSGSVRNAGFAYVLLLLAIALIGLSASAAVTLGATIARRDAERQLLAVGLEFQAALRSYAGLPIDAAPPGTMAGHGPRALEDLLKDPRVPGIHRHLRRIYADPLTGNRDWALVRDSQGFIIGIHSMAQGEPIKRAGFDMRLANFDDAPEYADWVFGLPAAQTTRPSATQAQR
jgi:type II secretory pathway pseudopilin PulG